MKAGVIPSQAVVREVKLQEQLRSQMEIWEREETAIALPNERGCLKTQSHRRSLHVVQRDRKLALPGGHYGVGNSCRPFAAVLVAAGY